MKRLLIAILFCVGCRGEHRDDVALPSNPPVQKQAPAVSRVTTAGRSTPSRCAGDGSYEQGLECFRISSGFHFTLGDVAGEMRRPTPGMERVEFKSEGTTWVGEAKKAGVVWSRNGKHELSPPDVTNRVWQRTTMVLDPQKKEGSPQLVGTENVGSKPSRHYHFTNANSGEANDVWVSTKDGRIVKWTMGSSTLELLMAGYSGTPLAKKLGIKPGFTIFAGGAPDNYAVLLAPLPDGVTFVKKLTSSADLIHLFTKSATELDAKLRVWREAIKSDTVIWVSWPKKASKVPTGITEDVIREICLPMGFVDVKVCAVDEVWSGLKLVIRRELRVSSRA